MSNASQILALLSGSSAVPTGSPVRPGGTAPAAHGGAAPIAPDGAQAEIVDPLAFAAQLATQLPDQAAVPTIPALASDPLLTPGPAPLPVAATGTPARPTPVPPPASQALGTSNDGPAQATPPGLTLAALIANPPTAKSTGELPGALPPGLAERTAPPPGLASHLTAPPTATAPSPGQPAPTTPAPNQPTAPAVAGGATPIPTASIPPQTPAAAPVSPGPGLETPLAAASSAPPLAPTAAAAPVPLQPQTAPDIAPAPITGAPSATTPLAEAAVQRTAAGSTTAQTTATGPAVAQPAATDAPPALVDAARDASASAPRTPPQTAAAHGEPATTQLAAISTLPGQIALRVREHHAPAPQPQRPASTAAAPAGQAPGQAIIGTVPQPSMIARVAASQSAVIVAQERAALAASGGAGVLATVAGSLGAAVADAAPLMIDPATDPSLLMANGGLRADALTAGHRPGGAGDMARPMMQLPAQQVAVQVAHAVQAGLKQITIVMRPPSLGEIDVDLEVSHDGRVRAAFIAEKPETLELLQRDARGLERALQEAGLRSDSGSLSFSLRGDGRERGHQGEMQMAEVGAGPTGEELDADDTTTVNQPPPPAGEHTIDIRA